MKLIITNKIDEKEISKINKINDELIVYDKNSGLVGWCHFFGTFLWQLRMNFDILYRPFISEYRELKTNRDEATLRLLHLTLKHAKQLFSDYDDAILRILKREDE